MTSPYDVAKGFVGQREGPANAMLNDFLNNGGQGLTSDQYAWCARFVKAAAAKSGLDVSGATDAARSFLNVGQPVQHPSEGDVAVLSRGNPGSGLGHVGFYAGPGSSPGTIKILAGNQGDAVSYADVPESRLLGYRHLGGDVAPVQVAAARTPSAGQETAPKSVMDYIGQFGGALAGESQPQPASFGSLSPVAQIGNALSPTQPQGQPKQPEDDTPPLDFSPSETSQRLAKLMQVVRARQQGTA